MKKMMFDDTIGLTDLVVRGLKTSTCRDELSDYSNVKYGEDGKIYGRKLDESYTLITPRYKVGDRVAVAQSYKTIEKAYVLSDVLPNYKESAGYTNKMFVRAILDVIDVDLYNEVLSQERLDIEKLRNFAIDNE